MEWLAANEGYRQSGRGGVADAYRVAVLRNRHRRSDRPARKTDADCVGRSARSSPPFGVTKLEDGRLVPFLEGHTEREYPRHRTLPPLYRLIGCIDAVGNDRVRSGGPLFGGDMAGFVTPPELSLDIDTEFDLHQVEWMLERAL